jgi:hypothetical protein
MRGTVPLIFCSFRFVLCIYSINSAFLAGRLMYLPYTALLGYLRLIVPLFEEPDVGVENLCIGLSVLFWAVRRPPVIASLLLWLTLEGGGYAEAS